MSKGGSVSAQEMTRRVDVLKGKIFDFVPDEVYYARFGFFDPSGSARCVFVLEPQHIFPTKIFESMKIWEEYYLAADIEHLRLEVGDIQFTQMVVTVDRIEKKVCRGFFLGSRPSVGLALLYVLDVGRLLEFPLSSLFATTELVAETQFTGFPCQLDHLGLFHKTNLLSTLMSTIALGMEPNTLCKVICKGFVEGEEKLPIVDFWPYTDDGETVEPLIDSESFNMGLATVCIGQWTVGLKTPPRVFSGRVVNVEKDALVTIHIDGINDDESPAVYMDAYLAKFKLADIEQKVPCLRKAAAVVGRLAQTPYITEFADDKCIYRCRVLEVPNYSATLEVEFLDYGDTAMVPYSKVFEVSAVDKVVALVPPLVWEAHLFTINKIHDVREALNMFLDETNLEFTICAGKRKGLPVVSITGKGPDGNSYNMIDKLKAAGIISPTN